MIEQKTILKPVFIKTILLFITLLVTDIALAQDSVKQTTISELDVKVKNTRRYVINFKDKIDSSKRQYSVCGSPLGTLKIDTINGSRFLVDVTDNIVGTIDSNDNLMLFPCSENDNSGLMTFLSKVKPFLIILFFYVLVVATFLIFQYYRGKKKRQNDETGSISWKYYITQTISVVLLVTFVFSLIALFFVNCIVDSTTAVNEKWFDAFKNFLILLGTSFTTLMGYFFGQGQAEKLELNNSKLQDKLNTKSEQLKDTELTAEEQIAQLEKQLDIITNKWQEAINKNAQGGNN